MASFAEVTMFAAPNFVTTGSLMALVLACPAPAGAQTPSQQPLLALRTVPAYRTSVETAARQSAVWTHAGCVTATFKPDEQIGIYRPPSFNAAGQPQAGAWRETEVADGCGASQRLNVLVMVRAPGALSYSSLLPGSTRADPLLQRDAVLYAVAAVPKQSKTCQQKFIADTDYIGSDGAPTAAAGLTVPWTEKWTLVECERRATVIVHFVPDATGTQITTSPNETEVH